MPEAAIEAARACPACGGNRVAIVLDAGSAPVNSCIQVHSAEAALAIPRGRVVLGHCPDCGYLFNAAFDQALTEYSARYEETQGYSAVFQAFHRALAERLIARFDLQRRRVLEIGCGKGEFLVLLAELGGNECVGFDPGHDPARMPAHALPIRVVQALYDESQAAIAADFVCCKMTLEHIAEPLRLLASIRRGQAAGTGVFFMVPDARRIIDTGAFEDIYYEHCAYYTAGSLRGLFERSGFEVLEVESLYAGQYLGLSARVAPARAEPPGGSGTGPCAGELADRAAMAGFADAHAGRVAHWRSRCRDWLAQGRRIALWGGGSKAVALLATLPELAGGVTVVDINPYRQGAFLPGTACRIESPERLRALRPDVVIVMNGIYRDEVTAAARALGLEGVEVLSL